MRLLILNKEEMAPCLRIWLEISVTPPRKVIRYGLMKFAR